MPAPRQSIRPLAATLKYNPWRRGLLHSPTCEVCLYRLSVTALAVAADDARAFTVSKDGSIIRMDIETGAR